MDLHLNAVISKGRSQMSLIQLANSTMSSKQYLHACVEMDLKQAQV